MFGCDGQASRCVHHSRVHCFLAPVTLVLNAEEPVLHSIVAFARRSQEEGVFPACASVHDDDHVSVSVVF